MMKKWVSIGLCVLLLLSLTACGKAEEPAPDPVVDENYVAGMAKLEEGNFAEAYTLLKAATDPKAAEVLEKFVFVPAKLTIEHSESGQNTVTTYTYDKAGRLLEQKKTGNIEWNTSIEMQDTYEYDDDGRLLKRTYRDDDFFQVETFTYNADGNELTYSYFPDGDEDAFSGRISTYDARGNLVKQEHFDGYDEAYNYTLLYTYDAQDRMLARTHTGYEGYTNVWTYTYDEEGNYYTLHKGGTYTQTVHYNKDGKLTKIETVDNDTGEVQELEEYRYDEKGNETYRRTVYANTYLNSETVHTTTYNELGLVLTTETLYDGEVYAMSAYTYDEEGRPLTTERFSGSVSWGQETYTYDEEGRLLSWKKMNNNGWGNTTYTYDEAGNRIKAEGKGNNATTTEDFTYDQWGNWLTYREYVTREDGDVACVASAEWQIQYYPDDIPEKVQTILTNATAYVQ